MSAKTPADKPERWAIDAGDAPGATLTIPADAKRERRFEIAVAVVVAVPEDAAEPWLQATVLAEGAQQWQRRAPAHNPGQYDGLDYRFVRTVPVGRPLRVAVQLATGGVRRRSLVIEAEEA